MPIRAVQAGEPLLEETMYKGEKMQVSHSYADWLSARSLTSTSVTAESSNTAAATVATDSDTSGVWTGTITGVTTGDSNIILTLTPSDSRTKKTVLMTVKVVDPDNV